MSQFRGIIGLATKKAQVKAFIHLSSGLLEKKIIGDFISIYGKVWRNRVDDVVFTGRLKCSCLSRRYFEQESWRRVAEGIGGLW